MRPTCLRISLNAVLCSGLLIAAVPQIGFGQATPSPTTPSNRSPNQQAALDAEAARAEQRQHIAELIEQLGDENFQQRRAAELALIRIGLPAFEQLRAAMYHPNVQIDVAARYLVRSQSVTWWLDTDPLSVRQVLQDYNQQKDDDRETAMQKLANEKSPDALIALCRIARYESSERLSKYAALNLMETLVERLEPTEAAKLVAHIREAMGDSNRPAAEWIATVVGSIETGEPNVDRWRQLANDEYVLLQKNQSDTSNVLVTRLHHVIAAHLTKHSRRDVALEIVRPSFDLVANKGKDIRTASMWAIDAGLPELVSDLAQRHAELFKTVPQLGYLLAEAQLAAGDADLAQTSAEAASESINRPKLEQNTFNISIDDMLATTRESLGEELNQRGMFEWAKSEYQKALKLELQPRVEFRLRVGLATLQSDGEEYAAAANTLGEFIEKIQDNAVETDRLSRNVYYDAANDMAFLLGTFNYYSGLAAFKERDQTTARGFYLQALKHYPENPDILIGLSQVVTPSVNDSEFQAAMQESISSFHEEIAQSERELLRADRMNRPTIEYTLAGKCNQLAWLLSKTQQRPEEALQLSLRSLELIPNYSVYQDTLARCYFAIGDVEKAIATQELAIENEPHQRTMLRQLDEFKAAKGTKR